MSAKRNERKQWKKAIMAWCLVSCLILSEAINAVYVCGTERGDAVSKTNAVGEADVTGQGDMAGQDDAQKGAQMSPRSSMQPQRGINPQDSAGEGGSSVAGKDDADATGQGDSKDADGTDMQGVSDGGASSFTIDNKNIYAGMKNSYSAGYIPKVEGNKAVVVLPLLAKQKMSGNQITVSLGLGESESLPFVYKNYEKAVKLGRHKVQGKGKKIESYLVTFNLELKRERYNGSYPVMLSVTGKDENGTEVYQTFTVYVTITDGKELAGDADGTGGAADELPQFAPRVMLHSYEFSEKEILCGERFTARMTLYNASKLDLAKNMMVTVQPGENVELLSKTDSDYVSELGIGESCDISFAFRVLPTAPVGQYDIGVTLDYADSKGNTYTVQQSVKVSAQQKVEMEIAPVNVPKNIEMGETLELQMQVMNLGKGKIYNVRAELEADGLMPSGVTFIGDLEAGTSMSGGMELTAEGLSGEVLYGTTQGKITFYYEDEMGNEMTQEQEFETSILSPLREESKKEAEDDTGQWWVIMGLIVVFLVQAALIFVMRRSRQMQMEEGKPDEEE